MRTIPLNHGQVAIVDDDDFDWLSQWKWHAKYSVHRRKWIAARGIRNHQNKAILLMHRQILNLTGSEQTDHINGDTLDNRRSNLRSCDASENCVNRRRRDASQFRGVFSRGERFRALFTFRGNKYYGGTHATAEEAARAYNELALRHCPEFAILNQV